MIPLEEAWRRIASQLAPLPPALVPRRRAAGRVLAEPLAARADVPGEDVSAMDGFALAGSVAPGASRPVAGTVAAGDPPGFALPTGAAVRIMTGAPVPATADRVVPVEQTERGGPRDTVTFTAGAERAGAGEHIRRRGEILRAGDPLLPAGTLLTPGALALLATHGYGELPVHRPPQVAVLTTGDEVVPPEAEPAPGQLRDSHTDFLLAAGASLGISFEPLGIAPDREPELRELVRRGLEADVLLLCGGVSAGEFDLVEGVLAELGCRTLFDAVAIQPGKPLVFAVLEREEAIGSRPAAAGPRKTLVFGLPGNPASVMVSFWLFVRPTLRRLCGLPDGYWQGALQGTLAAPLLGAGPRDRFLPAEVAVEDGALRVTPYPPKGSHDLAAYAHGTALVRVRAGSPPAPAGAMCEVLLLVPGEH